MSALADMKKRRWRRVAGVRKKETVMPRSTPRGGRASAKDGAVKAYSRHVLLR